MTDDPPTEPPPSEPAASDATGGQPPQAMQAQPADEPMFPMPTMENICGSELYCEDDDDD